MRKNGLAASPNAAAYCTAKAAEIHLARCLALEGAPEGIRVNVVNPDAVLRGSKIWAGEWLEQRAIIRIDNLTIYEGRLSPRVLGLVVVLLSRRRILVPFLRV